jgi:hypothetical protein
MTIQLTFIPTHATQVTSIFQTDEDKKAERSYKTLVDSIEVAYKRIYANTSQANSKLTTYFALKTFQSISCWLTKVHQEFSELNQLSNWCLNTCYPTVPTSPTHYQSTTVATLTTLVKTEQLIRKYFNSQPHPPELVRIAKFLRIVTNWIALHEEHENSRKRKLGSNDKCYSSHITPPSSKRFCDEGRISRERGLNKSTLDIF